MATITCREITEAFTRLGELAASEGEQVELLLVGGGLMVLALGTRDSTRDLDVMILKPSETAKVRRWVQTVATEHGWPEDWLNDGAKGYIIGHSEGDTLFSASGIEVRRPSYSQLLAMKLCAWRDEVDIADARRLLEELNGSREDTWRSLSRFLIPGSELKAQYAFDDLWEVTHGRN